MSLRARSVDLHRWLECVPKQHHAGLSRKSEKDGWERTMLFGRVARSLYCHDHQAYEEKTGGRSHASPETRTHGESASPPAENSRLSAVQYLLDRTLQCHDAGTAGFSRPKMSSRRSSSPDLGDRNVFDWMHYNFCWPHQELSTTKHYGRPCTPAMAAGLTDHIWSVCELLS